MKGSVGRHFNGLSALALLGFDSNLIEVIHYENDRAHLVFSFRWFQHWWWVKVVRGSVRDTSRADSPSGAGQATHKSWDGIVDVFPCCLAVESWKGRQEAFVNGLTKCFCQ